MEQSDKRESNTWSFAETPFYIFLVILAVAALSFFTGCASYRTCPDLSEVPPGKVLAIDGTWKNRYGVVFRLERGRMYTMKELGDLSANRVIKRDFIRLNPGHYKCEGETFNKKKEISDFSTETMVISSINSITFNAAPNPVTAYKGGRYSMSLHKLDDEQSFLRELLATIIAGRVNLMPQAGHGHERMVIMSREDMAPIEFVGARIVETAGLRVGPGILWQLTVNKRKKIFKTLITKIKNCMISSKIIGLHSNG